jgi:hypothetical protein
MGPRDRGPALANVLEVAIVGQLMAVREAIGSSL